MRYECPSEFGCPPFNAEPEEHTSLSSHDVPVRDAAGNPPTLAEAMEDGGARLTRAAWTELSAQTNPAWTPTYRHEILALDGTPIDPGDRAAIEAATVVHLKVTCPACGSPVKVG